MEIDDEKLKAAGAILGTRSKRGTVDAALDAVIDRRRREQLVERLQSMDGFDLRDPSVMDRAWR